MRKNKKKWGAGNIKERKKGGKPGCACAHPRVQHYQHCVLLILIQKEEENW